jgi:hypothetical protein
MNAEVIKAMNKKEKKHDFRKWWNNNGYKVLRVILFPIWIFTIIYKKINVWLNARNKWSDERAKEILNYYIPRRAKWNAEDKDFYFFNNGYGWNLCFAKKHLKRKDRRWWELHNGFCGGKIREYLINEFELEGFEKDVRDIYGGWTEIIFKMIEE